jgi:hypothetical protein
MYVSLVEFVSLVEVWGVPYERPQANLKIQDPRFVPLYGCAKLHFTTLAQTLAHAFGDNV